MFLYTNLQITHNSYQIKKNLFEYFVPPILFA